MLLYIIIIKKIPNRLCLILLTSLVNYAPLQKKKH